ncbi:hypothetical protein [Dielma fastidiosa]|uniref:hypothetical protein n=1 Tax=Dielma fastidiosa TaxID=1034346 RepID=UPI0015F90B86|nr:hypothetical protein [Dielma fastidiosa]
MTNEERAHDIALVTAKLAFKLKIDEAIKNGDASISVDFYTTYKNAYEIALKSVNEDFK